MPLICTTDYWLAACLGIAVEQVKEQRARRADAELDRPGQLVHRDTEQIGWHHTHILLLLGANWNRFEV